MKKQLLLPILCIFLFTTQLKASHLVGGQISWECLNNGKYVFYMEIYRECTGTSFSFTTQTLQILNSSLPAIAMKPDTARYALYDEGNISPKGSNGNQLVCKNGSGGSDLGATQFFPFKSDPVNLNGVPPTSGWVFHWTSCCRPSNAENLSNPGSQGYGLRAIMYPYKGTNSSSCYDSSPKFMDNSIATASDNASYAFSCLAKDLDEDSLSYFFDIPLDASVSGNMYVPNPVYYTKGYSHTSPFLDTSTYSIGLAAKLDQHSGFIKGGKVYGNSGDIYAYSVRVDSYREGVKIASVWKDAALLILNYANMSGQASIHINTASTNSYSTTIELGDSISIPINIVDTNLYADTNNPGTFRARDMSLQYFGEMFSLDYKDANNCQGRLSPCAGISPAPIYDSIIYNKFVSLDSASINLNLNWKIACDFLTSPSSKNLDSKYVNFLLKLINDQNPPQVHDASIQLKVERYQPAITRFGSMLVVDTADSYKWYYNDSLLPNSDSSSISMQASGKYSVEVIKNGCPSKLISHILFSVGTEEVSWKKQIEIYPNPFVTDQIEVYIPQATTKDFSFKLYDLQGKEVNISHNSFRDSKYKLQFKEELPTGMYFLKLSSEGKSAFYKIIKN